MSKQSTNTVVSPAALELMETKIFEQHTVRDCMDDFQKMYFHYMCDENIENAYDRQTATVSFKTIAKALTSIEKHQDPDDIVGFEISFDL